MRALLYLVGLIAMTLTPTASATDALRVERFGLYLRVSNLDASRTFYERVLGKQPYVTNDRLVGFELAGGLLALFQDEDVPVIRGTNAVPYIRVTDANLEFTRLKRLGVRLRDEKVIVEGPLNLFRFFDPDGNTLEIFSLAQ